MNIRLQHILQKLEREDGVATTAIAIPGTILLVVIALQAALWFLGSNVAQNAAVDAYRNARAYQATADIGTAAGHRVLTRTGEFLTHADVQVERTPTTVRVTVTGTVISLIPGLILPAVRRTITGPIERWVPAP